MIKLGLIGLGYWGENYLRIIDESTDARLLQVCDLKTNDLIAPDISYTKNYHDVLDNPEIDAVVIATPAHTHYQIANDALRHGKHVLVEKPLALNSKECRSLIDLSDREGLSLMSGHIYYFNNYIAFIKECIEAKLLGSPISFSSKRLNYGPVRQDLDATWDLAIHDITILNFIFNQKPKKILVDKKNTDLRKSLMPNYSFIKLGYWKIDGTIEADWLYPDKVRQLEIIFQGGVIKFDETKEKKLEILKKGGGGTREVEFKNNFTNSEPLGSELQWFLDSIRDRDKSKMYHDEYISIINTLEMGDKSFEERKEISI